MPPTQRDLASEELWQRSLERSRHRRELAPLVRKTASRRKRLSLAVSAAVAAAPSAPSLALGGTSVSGGQPKHSLSLVDHHTDPILLHVGTTSAAVAQLQRALRITADGIFGPQTEAAVRAFQQEHGLPPTGKVDVKTWLTLFPNDAVVATPAGWSANTSAGPTVSDAENVSSAGASGSAAGAASIQTGGSSGANSGAGDGAVAHAASFSGHAPAGDPGAASTGGVAGDVASAFGAPPAAAGADPAISAPSIPTGDPSGTGTGDAFGNGGSAVTGGPTPQVSTPTLHPQGTAADLIAKMIAAANRITAHHYAYSWGGGHNSSFSGPYDCSGAVSAVLHAAGLLNAPMVSGDFVHWGAPGPGAVTIYANATHVYMSIYGHFFGTSFSNPGGGAAWFNGAPRPGFAVVHVPFERMHLRPPVRVRAARVSEGQHVRRGGHGANVTYASDGGTAAPQAQASDQPTYDQAPPPSAAPQSSSGGTSDSSSGGTQSSSDTSSTSSDTVATSESSQTSTSSDSAPASSSVGASDSTPAPASAGTLSSGSSGASDSTPSATTVASDSGSSPGSGASSGAVSSTPAASEAPATPSTSSADTAAPVESSHVSVSSDAGSGSSAGSDTASKAPSGSAAGSSSTSGDSGATSHASAGGSGSGVVKASDG